MLAANCKRWQCIVRQRKAFLKGSGENIAIIDSNLTHNHEVMAESNLNRVVNTNILKRKTAGNIGIKSRVATEHCRNYYWS